MSNVTRILDAIEHGDAKAADELLPLVYEELRKLAAHRMQNESPKNHSDLCAEVGLRAPLLLLSQQPLVKTRL